MNSETSRWWCFNNEKLERALAEHFARPAAHGVALAPELQPHAAALVRTFLNSPEARANKLIGGES